MSLRPDTQRMGGLFAVNRNKVRVGGKSRSKSPDVNKSSQRNFNNLNGNEAQGQGQGRNGNEGRVAPFEPAESLLD